MLRESQPPGLPEMGAEDCLGRPRTPHLTPEADTTHQQATAARWGNMRKIPQQPTLHAEHTATPGRLEAGIALNYNNKTQTAHFQSRSTQFPTLIA